MSASPMTANARARSYRHNRHATDATPLDPSDRRVVMYVRVSKSRDDMSSPEIQTKACQRHIKAQGWRLVQEPIIEEGESAYQGKSPRPGFKRALELVRTGVANTLIVYKLDRFMRDADDAVSLKRDLHSWGGSLVSATEMLDTGDTGNPMVGILFGILANLAEIESRTKSDRIKDWHANRYARDGGALPPPGPTPFGYKRGRNTLTIIDEQAETIRTAAARIMAGEGLKGVAESLSTPKRKLSRTGLKHILTSETTAGLRFDGTTHHVGNWEPILERDEWEALCATLNDPNRLTAGPRGERRHLMAGIITCGVEGCGHPLYMRTHYKGPRYGCSARTCYNSILASAVDEAIRKHIVANLDADTWAAMRASGRINQVDVIADLQRKLAVITDAYIAAPSSPATEADYARSRALINESIQKAQESTPIELPNVMDVAAEWHTLDIDAKRLIINAWFESITLAPYETGMSADDRLGYLTRV